jgi:hypothetical protein
MSKLIDSGVKETTGLKLQEKTETAGVLKKETVVQKSGQSVEKSHEYKMAQILTSNVDLIEYGMQMLLKFDSVKSDAAQSLAHAIVAKNRGVEEEDIMFAHCILCGHSYRKNRGVVEEAMFTSHCILCGHFYRLFCAGRQHVMLVYNSCL